MTLVYFHEIIVLMLYFPASLLHDLLPHRNKNFSNEHDPTAKQKLVFVKLTRSHP